MSKRTEVGVLLIMLVTIPAGIILIALVAGYVQTWSGISTKNKLSKEYPTSGRHLLLDWLRGNKNDDKK
jgi:hypothetical protein